MQDDRYSIIMCDVGQGDSILIQFKDTQMLIDGGPSSDVLDCLSSFMPFWDTTIDIIVLTHPQSDHFGGLLSVFDSYNVSRLLATEVENSSDAYQEFKKKVIEEGSDIIIARENMTLSIADAHVTVINPDIPVVSGQLGDLETRCDLNEFSITLLFDYKDFEMLLTGDIGPDVITDLADDGQLTDIDVLKVPHHGSKNGLTYMLLDYTRPEYALIGVGKDNRFGHPHKVILDLLSEFNVDVYRTDELGNIVFKTDGITISK